MWCGLLRWEELPWDGEAWLYWKGWGPGGMLMCAYHMTLMGTFRTRLFPQQPSPTTQSVKSPNYLGPGFFSWPLSDDPKCSLSNEGQSWWTMTTTIEEAESLGRWAPDPVFQASLQAPCLHLLNLSLCLALWTAASAGCPQFTSQPESFCGPSHRQPLWFQANINHGLHLFKESMPVPLPRTPSSWHSCAQIWLLKPSSSSSFIFYSPNMSFSRLLAT